MVIASTTPSTRSATVAATANGGQTSGVTIAIKPGANNVDSGDRSNNTLEASITTANRQVSAEFTREQATNGLERRLQQRAIHQFGNTNQGLNPLTLRAIQNSDIDAGDVNEIASVRRQKQLAETYLNAAPSSPPSTNTVGGNATNNGVALYNQAVNAYIKQTLAFSALDQASSGFSTTA